MSLGPIEIDLVPFAQRANRRSGLAFLPGFILHPTFCFAIDWPFCRISPVFHHKNHGNNRMTTKLGSEVLEINGGSVISVFLSMIFHCPNQELANGPIEVSKIDEQSWQMVQSTLNYFFT